MLVPSESLDRDSGGGIESVDLGHVNYPGFEAGVVPGIAADSDPGCHVLVDSQAGGHDHVGIGFAGIIDQNERLVAIEHGGTGLKQPFGIVGRFVAAGDGSQPFPDALKFLVAEAAIFNQFA